MYLLRELAENVNAARRTAILAEKYLFDAATEAMENGASMAAVVNVCSGLIRFDIEKYEDHVCQKKAIAEERAGL